MKTGKIAWWEMDMPEGRIRFDDRKATMLGYDPQIFEHYRDFTNLIHPDDLNLAMQSMNNHLKGITEEYAIDYRIRDVSGNYHWYRDVGKITQRYDDKNQKFLPVL
jgi:PAS fold.